MRKLIVKRFEGNFAICEEEKSERLFGIDRKELPQDALEGATLEISEDGAISVVQTGAPKASSFPSE